LYNSGSLKKPEKVLINNESPFKTTFGKSKNFTISNKKNKTYAKNDEENGIDLHKEIKKPSKHGTLN